MGIAPGVDRMVMLLAGEDSIREIIPFPMNKNAQDLMMGAPSEVSQSSSTSCISLWSGRVKSDRLAADFCVVRRVFFLYS